jgi:hypothetical protein
MWAGEGNLLTAAYTNSAMLAESAESGFKKSKNPGRKPDEISFNITLGSCDNEPYNYCKK